MAPVSIVTEANSIYFEPSPFSVPALAPDANSSVLTTEAPIVLPPETRPEKVAPGATMTRSAKPGLAASKAYFVPPIEPRFTTVVW